MQLLTFLSLTVQRIHRVKFPAVHVTTELDTFGNKALLQAQFFKTIFHDLLQGIGFRPSRHSPRRNGPDFGTPTLVSNPSPIITETDKKTRFTVGCDLCRGR